MVKYNKDKLVMVAVQGEVSHPRQRSNPYRIDTRTGVPKVLPGTGGITYNKKIGDICTGFQADHVEPGVTLLKVKLAM
jgi:hypothetical protein